MKSDLFQSCGHCWAFQICWHTWSSTFTASSFSIWNSSAPLALFVKNPPSMWETCVPGEENSYSFQYSGLENSMDYIVHGITKSQTWLSNFHFQEIHTKFLKSMLDHAAFPDLPLSSPNGSFAKPTESVSPVAQLVNNLPAVQETWVWSLGWEDPLEKRMSTHSSIPAWRIPWTEDLVGYSPWGCKEWDTTERLTLSLSPYQLEYWNKNIHYLLNTFYTLNNLFSSVCPVK